MEVLILGHNGMLGHMVKKYLLTKNVNVITTDTRWPESKDIIKKFNGDYIINCIGSIPQKTDTFDLNWEIPIWLDLNTDVRIIHPGTDCESDNTDYGLSKNTSGEYIRTVAKRTKSLKCSIIGPEINSNSGLMEWFLSQEGEVYGYTLAIWNGNTTLEWSKQCLKLMREWDNYSSETIIFSNTISKYMLLKQISNIFNKEINVLAKPEGENKAMFGLKYTKDIKKQLEELKSFYYEN